MKAKEHYEQFLRDEKELGEIQAFTNLINKYFAGVGEIAKMRGTKSNPALVSIFKEQNRKWNAMRKFDPRFKRDGFIEFTKHRMPFFKFFLKETG